MCTFKNTQICITNTHAHKYRDLFKAVFSCACLKSLFYWLYWVCSVARLCLTLRDPMDCSPPGSFVHGDSPGKNTGVGCHALLQGIFPITQGPNPGLLHCRQALYHLSHQGSPGILKKVPYSFSRGASHPGIEPGSPTLQADSLPAKLPFIDYTCVEIWETGEG